MNSFELVTAPTHLPITVDAAQKQLALAVVEEIERTILWRSVVAQTRKITVDGELPSRLEIEPVTDIVSLTRWTPDNDAEEIPADEYIFVSRDPLGTIIAPLDGHGWPRPHRSIGSFTITYMAGFEVTDTLNTVPTSIVHMLTRAVEHRSGGSGLGNIQLGSLQMDVSDSYKTDALPREITDIARGWNYRPGLFIGRP